MLYAKVVLWVKEDETTSDSKVILYRGDYNIDIEFTLKSGDYILSNSAYAQMVLSRPYAESIFSEIFKITNGKVTIRITRGMIDEMNERESYALQIRLFDDKRVARATLPPCYDVIYIKEPIAPEPETFGLARVNDANVNYSVATTSLEELGDIFTDDTYNMTTWFDGDLITDGRLNKIENALLTLSEREGGGGEGGMTDAEREQLEQNTQDISTILGVIDTPPTYTQPSLSLTISPSTLEHNKETRVTITPNFSKNDGGNPTKYSLSRNGTVIHNSSSPSTYTDNINVSHNSSVSYSATVTYSAGPVKNTLLGVPYPSTSIKGGNVSGSGSSRAYAPSYYGVITNSTIGENDISLLTSRLASGKSFTNTFDLSEQRVVYLYPKSFGTLASIKDANNFDYINSYTRTTLSNDGVEYYVYILTDPVTINDFKQIFN